ncbi:MAG: cysteine--tRNA ligase [Verrucomicrobiae bacterium]|nr:cysteine--tRNA ligase [Verrucomicrobiae bacterium]
MPLQLYDTLSRGIHPILPEDGKTLRFYCCGPTVYGPAHIGNFRTFVMQDIFRRVVEVGGLATRHVRNVTDVDDKTIRQSQEEGRRLSEFTTVWTDRFHKDCAALGILPPHIEPSAVAHIPEQIDLIAQLMKKGHAYRTPDGSVYYDVRSFPAYGRLSRLAEREITTDAVDREQDDEYERASAADFALWKAARPEDGPNHWTSPWGNGRPGWHIECSTMAMKQLGESFDLHSGGIDLVFPHHENEIAQSEAATGKTFARHWFHVAHLTVDGRKMSKSLGNLYTLDDLANLGHGPMELRYVLLSGNYRQPLNFTLSSLAASRKALARLSDWQQRLGGQPDRLPPGEGNFGPFASVYEALLSDLNTSEALGRLHSRGREVIAAVKAGELSDQKIEAARHGFALVLQSLGLTLPSTEHAANAVEKTAPAGIHALATERCEARHQRDWALADQLRDQIHEAGWVILDGIDGYTLEAVSEEQSV